jgi:hypothetical protein
MTQEILPSSCTVNYGTKNVQELPELNLLVTIIVEIENNQEFSVSAKNNVKSEQLKKSWLNIVSVREFNTHLNCTHKFTLRILDLHFCLTIFIEQKRISKSRKARY